ncbi:hypothetical protein Pelo_18916 [Pelomyxa schiedti]|nr:hypothetical protein Pelo_18916 [Pelomyxa schiedti]
MIPTCRNTTQDEDVPARKEGKPASPGAAGPNLGASASDASCNCAHHVCNADRGACVVCFPGVAVAIPFSELPLAVAHNTPLWCKCNLSTALLTRAVAGSHLHVDVGLPGLINAFSLSSYFSGASHPADLKFVRSTVIELVLGSDDITSF